MRLRELIEGLELLKRKNSWHSCLQTSSTRRTAKILSEIHSVSHTAVWKWIKKFEKKLPISTEKKKEIS